MPRAAEQMVRSREMQYTYFLVDDGLKYDQMLNLDSMWAA